MRAVIDNNLLVSYLITHRPPIAEIIDVHLARGNFDLVIADSQLDELDRVLQYPHIQKYYDEAERLQFIALLASTAEVIEIPGEVPKISRDPADDWIIAGAVAGNADVILSGDRDLLDLRQVGRIMILTARQFLDYLKNLEGS
jgi:putative PIN family toxin of toxin-antitoxin system